METGSRKKRVTTEGFLGIFIIIILVGLYFTAGGTQGFFSIQNIMTVLRMFSALFIASIGMTMIIITGNIDISVGAVVSVIAVVMAAISLTGAGIAVFLPVGMIVGGILCAINAFLMTKFNIPSLVITLATMQIFNGALLWAVDGSLYGLGPNWTWFSFEAIFFNYVPLYVIIVAVLLVASLLFFKYSRFIKRLYAIGNNVQGARYAGINVEKTLIIAYFIAGVLLAFSSVIFATFGTRVTTTVGNLFEMRVIAAVIVGGTSALGGSGKIYGTALGALLLSIISPALVHLGINTFWMDFFLGTIIVIAVIFSALKNIDFKSNFSKIAKKEANS